MFLVYFQNTSTPPALLITFTSFQPSSDFTSSKSTKKIVRKSLFEWSCRLKITTSIPITANFQGDWGKIADKNFVHFNLGRVA